MYKYIVDELSKKGFEGYIVGGAVRDLLMNKTPKDYDIVTSAKPEEIKDVFKGEKVSTVGESFKVVIVNGIEVATFRKDRYFGLSDKNVEIKYAKTLEQDLKRRDLTINSIAMNKDKIIDPFNGQKDIRLRRIKFTGRPKKRIFEDPCRLLRALRFCCLFPDFYNIDHDTYFAIKEYSDMIKCIAPVRIKLEILKVMEYKQPSLFFQLLKEFGLLSKIFPSLEDGYYWFDGKYHNETIFLHNMIVGDSITKRKPLLRLAGYLHDIGKPSTFNGKNYKGHDKKGAELASIELKNLRFSNEEIEYITNLIKTHMVYLKKLSKKGIRRLNAKLYERNINWKDLIQLRLADRKGNLKKENYTRKEIKDWVINLTRQLEEAPVFSIRNLDIDGHQVMKILEVSQGPIVGKVLKYLFEEVIKDPKFNDSNKLRTYLRWNKQKFKNLK